VVHSLGAMIVFLLAYGLGSLSSAVIVCKIMGLPDPRQSGSGNPGATNVLRVGGKKAALFTFIADSLKGVIAILFTVLLNLNPIIIAASLLGVVVGHCYPVFFQFKGGKGVATTLGALLALHWPLGLLVIAIWLLIFACFRRSSLAALTAIVLMPFYAWHTVPLPSFIALLTVCCLLVWRHRSNIQNLLRCEEKPITNQRSSGDAGV
jgi:glycerol-3-phosphate acyltransferase PlsY